MKAQTFEKDTIRKEKTTIEITFIKHASFIISYQGRTIYVDPLSEYADMSKMPKADLVLITHDHYDHLDPKAITQIECDKTILVANKTAQEKLGKGNTLSNGETKSIEGFAHIEAVPAYNITEGHTHFHPKHHNNGYILTLGEIRLYIAGDTENIEEMGSFRDIDIAFLPVNQPYTMTPAQAADAARRIKPTILYPYHYGDTKIEELKHLLKDEESIQVRIRQMQ